MTTEVETNKIADIVREMLTERFHDEFVFSPIIVEPRIDHDGDEYLHTYIVFDGDQNRLGSYMDRRACRVAYGRMRKNSDFTAFRSSRSSKNPKWAEFFESKYRESSGSAQNR